MDSCHECEKPARKRGLCYMHYSRLQRHGDLTTVKPPGKPAVVGACEVDGCKRTDLRGLGLCGKHYQRQRTHGDPLILKLDPGRSVEERFWEKVNKNGPIPERCPELGPCWVWTGGTSEGYGMFWLDGTQVRAHILSFTWAKGEIAEGQERDHLCRNRRCVNPDHLEAVTHWTNTARGEGPAALNLVKTHCGVCGTEYSKENTYLYRNQRHCRNCMRRRNREWQARKRAAQRAAKAS